MDPANLFADPSDPRHPPHCDIHCSPHHRHHHHDHHDCHDQPPFWKLPSTRHSSNGHRVRILFFTVERVSCLQFIKFIYPVINLQNLFNLRIYQIHHKVFPLMRSLWKRSMPQLEAAIHNSSIYKLISQNWHQLIKLDLSRFISIYLNLAWFILI